MLLCPSLHLLGRILLCHMLIKCDHNFVVCGLVAHRCRIILVSPPSWMIWIFLHGISQIPGSCQTGCQILGYQITWSGFGWWVSGSSNFQIIGPHLGLECTQWHHRVLLMLRIYPLVHWWLPHINCEILLHHTVGLLLITASSSYHHNRFL